MAVGVLQDLYFLAFATSRLRLVDDDLPRVLAAELEARGVSPATNSTELAHTAQALSRKGFASPSLDAFLQAAVRDHSTLFQKWQIKMIKSAIKVSRKAQQSASAQQSAPCS